RITGAADDQVAEYPPARIQRARRDPDRVRSGNPQDVCKQLHGHDRWSSCPGTGAAPEGESLNRCRLFVVPPMDERRLAPCRRMLATTHVQAVTFLDRGGWHRGRRPALPRMVHAHFPAPHLVSGAVLRLLAVATAARAPGFASDESAGWAAAVEGLGS